MIHTPNAPLSSAYTLLASASPADRRLAAKVLSGHPEAREALLAALAIEASTLAQVALLNALIEIPDEGVIDDLLERARTAPHALRSNLVMTLWKRPAALIRRAPRLLRSPAPSDQLLAISILSGTRSPEAAGLLAEVVVASDNVELIAHALDGLAELGTLDVLPQLEAARPALTMPLAKASLEMTLEMIRERAA